MIFEEEEDDQNKEESVEIEKEEEIADKEIETDSISIREQHKNNRNGRRQRRRDKLKRMHKERDVNAEVLELQRKMNGVKDITAKHKQNELQSGIFLKCTKIYLYHILYCF